MPIPGGELTSSQIWMTQASSAEELDAIIDKLIEESDAEEDEDQAAFDAAMAEELEKVTDETSD